MFKLTTKYIFTKIHLSKTIYTALIQVNKNVVSLVHHIGFWIYFLFFYFFFTGALNTKKITPMMNLLMAITESLQNFSSISDNNECHRLQKKFFEAQFPFMSNKKHFAEKAMNALLLLLFSID